MSFAIHFKPQDPIDRGNGATAQLLELSIPSTHPDFPKHARYLTLLCSQFNQISGINSELGEQVVNTPELLRPGHCRKCNNLSTINIPKDRTPIVSGFLHEFSETAYQGCEICRLILTAVMPCEGPGRLKAYIRPGAALNILVKSADKNARYDLFTPMGQPLSPWPGIGPSRIVGLKNWVDRDMLDMLQSWIQDCRSHQSCRSSGLPSVSPTRVIYVARDGLRLEVPKAFDKPYVALSHCWGTSNLPRMLKSNMASLRQRIPWETLTKTFQDALVLTMQLGYHYIWIDSLCICQDDPQDWEIEAAKMAGIYENAALVISATSAKDGSVGLFHDRKPAQTLCSQDTQFSSTVREHGNDVRIIHLHDNTCRDPNCPIYICRDTARHAQWDSFDIIAKSSDAFNPLLSRAWAFQERLLASRIVHFTDHELIWECKETQRCECMHLDRADGRPILERSSNNLKSRFSKITSSETASPAPAQLELFDLWAKVVESYTSRLLTYEKDRLLALQGAVTKMQKFDLGECVGGLFLSDMPRCLLWHVPEPGTRHAEYRAPTWSWASINPPKDRPPRVEYRWHHVPEGMRKPDDAAPGSHIKAVSECTIVKTANSPGGADARYGLRFHGPLIQAQLSIKTQGEAPLHVGADYEFLMRDQPSHRNYMYSIVHGGQKVSFEPDVVLHDPDGAIEQVLDVFLLAVARRHDTRNPDQVLVLQQLRSAEDFAALGMLRQGADEGVLVCARVGIISELKDAAEGWFDDAVVQRKNVLVV